MNRNIEEKSPVGVLKKGLARILHEELCLAVAFINQ